MYIKPPSGKERITTFPQPPSKNEPFLKLPRVLRRHCFTSLANLKQPCLPNSKESKLRQAILGPTECSQSLGQNAAIGVGRQTRTLRPAVRQQEALRLCAPALQRPLRREHILGQRQRVDAGRSRGRMGFGEQVLSLRVEFLHPRTDVWALYPDCLGRDEADRLREGELFWR